MRAAAERSSGLLRMERNWGILLALPAILGFLIFTIGPMLASFVIGMTDWEIGSAPSFIGLDNYRTMLTDDPLFLKSLSVTLYYSFGSVPLLLVVAFVVAMLLNQGIRARSFFRTLFFLPTLMPLVATAVVWQWVFNPDFGLFNSLLDTAGLPTSGWIFNEGTVVPSLILVHAWGFGNAALIFLAGLQGVPRHLYEAVAVDGGNAWHRLRYITLPMMSPTIFFNLVIGLIWAFQEFVLPYVMTLGGPNNASLTFVYYLWRIAFQERSLGYASALSWVLFAVVLVVTIVVFRTARHWVYYEAGSAR